MGRGAADVPDGGDVAGVLGRQHGRLEGARSPPCAGFAPASHWHRIED